MVHVLLLVACAVVIYLACEWFVNAVEWLGVALKVGPLAVGTILAAAGTALPESVVTLVAVTVDHGEQGKDVGVGAAMGGPLALSTIAYAVTGLVLLLRHRTGAARPLLAALPAGPGPGGSVEAPGSGGSGGSGGSDGSGGPADPDVRPAGGRHGIGLERSVTDRLARDQVWFLAIFVVKVGLGLVAFAVKPWLGLLFFAMYGLYFWHEIRGGGEAGGEDLEPLKLLPARSRPPLWAVGVQTLITLAVVFGASQLFVAQLEWAGPALGLPAAVVALLLSPVATELPEVMNAIIWVRAGKTRLALANISGAMMIQATVPSGLGLLFTSWRFDGPLLLSGLATMAAISYLLATMRAGRLTALRLTGAAGAYLVFAAGLVVLV
ncbi:MAG TPA: sodium:calcium antiporter [Kineosporiaceae bacterium]|nr:sodium:calcium antiporter [Kineosporiaceae bacterium]